MRTTRLTTLIVLASLVSLAPPSHGQGSTQGGGLEVDLRPREAEVGDLIVATLTATSPPEAIAQPVFPEWEETWGEAEVREVGPVEDTGRNRFRQTVTLTMFRPGEVVLPPVKVEVPTAEEILLLESEPQTFEIRSVLPPDEENPEARPPAPPRALPMGESFWRTTLALAAVCLIAGVLLARRRSHALAQEVAPVPPLEALTRGLQSLRQAEDAEAFHTGLSLHLRRFLGRSFGFPAVESTTTEVRHRLSDAEIPRTLVSRAEKILRLCDLVKFARATAAPESPGNPSARLDEALALGRELDHHLHPPEAPITDEGTEQAA